MIPARRIACIILPPDSSNKRAGPLALGAMSDLTAAYHHAIQRIHGQPDPLQLEIIDYLDALSENLATQRNRWWQRWLGTSPVAPKGLYLYGGVGRGKTFLMDLFFAELDIAAKRRAHFHRFMQDVHAELKSLPDVEDPLAIVADRIAETTRVICFDEFFVSDIGDAMILGRLLTHCFDRGVALVATSNVEPNQLYRDGLQRARFQPAIAALEAHCTVMSLDGDTDYRFRTLTDAGSFSTICGEAGRQRMAQLIEQLSAGRTEPAGTVTINGREIAMQARGPDCIWFQFLDLCDGPRSAADYIDIANRFSTVLVADVPVFSATTNDQARRFITLVDEFYDRRVNLVICAEAQIDELYAGGRLAFEFERTRSRLTEMRSSAYLSSARQRPS